MNNAPHTTTNYTPANTNTGIMFTFVWYNQNRNSENDFRFLWPQPFYTHSRAHTAHHRPFLHPTFHFPVRRRVTAMHSKIRNRCCLLLQNDASFAFVIQPIVVILHMPSFHSHNLTHKPHIWYILKLKWMCSPLPSSMSFSAIWLRIVHFYRKQATAYTHTVYPVNITTRTICSKCGWNANRRLEVLGIAFVCACCRRWRWFYGGSELS